MNVIESDMFQTYASDYNQNIFNWEYKYDFMNYLVTHTFLPKNVIGWLTDIINQIPFRSDE
jgi:hypothetical protein